MYVCNQGSPENNCSHWQPLFCILQTVKGMMNVDPREGETELQSLFPFFHSCSRYIQYIVSWLSSVWLIDVLIQCSEKGINREKQLLHLRNHRDLERFGWCFSLTTVKLHEWAQKTALIFTLSTTPFPWKPCYKTFPITQAIETKWWPQKL